MQKKGLVFLLLNFAAIILMACSGSDRNAIMADHLRSFDDSRTEFIPNKDAMNLKSISGDEISLILGCEKPSSTVRLDTKKYSTSYKKVERSQENLDMPIIVTTSKTGYATQNDGELYNESFSLIDFSLNGSLIMQSPYSYVDTCTLSQGCDIDKRSFSVGSPIAIVKTNSKMMMTYQKATEEIANLNCMAQPDEKAEVIDDSLEQGIVNLSGVIYPAVRVTSMQNVKIYCGNQEVAKGVARQRQIVIGDHLPRTTEFTTQNAGSKSLNCMRTQIFSSQSVSFDGAKISGSSTDLSEYAITGVVKSLEEWEKEQVANMKTLKALENAVVLAQERRDTAYANLAGAKSDSANKYSAYTQAQAETYEAQEYANEVAANPESTEAEKKAANDKALSAAAKENKLELSYNVSVKAVTEAQNAYNVAVETLSKAKQALADFNQNKLKETVATGSFDPFQQ